MSWPSPAAATCWRWAAAPTRPSTSARSGRRRSTQNFANFQKTGTSTWTLTGTTASLTNWAINGGTLAISADNNLGGGSLASLDGGTVQFNAAFTSARTFALNAGGGTFDTNGNAVTLFGQPSAAPAA